MILRFERRDYSVLYHLEIAIITNGFVYLHHGVAEAA